MTDDALSLRLATADDVPFLARVITEVAEGIVETLMGGLFPGVRAEKLLQMILGKGAGAYRIEHAVIADYRGEAAGLLFSYDASEQKVSPLMRGLVPKKRLSQCEELLAATADDAWWVDTFWVAPQYRGEGLAQILMACAEDLAREAGRSRLALHCYADNARALRFYEKAGFKPHGVVHYSGDLLQRHPANGLVLVKELAA